MTNTLFSRVGGERFFVALVERFYTGVEADPVLRPLYPTDLEPGKARLAAFLIQRLGGPPVYSAQRGHPRLMVRHRVFPIGQRERDAWVFHMTVALRDLAPAPEDFAELASFFEGTATALINRSPDPAWLGLEAGDTGRDR